MTDPSKHQLPVAQSFEGDNLDELAKQAQNMYFLYLTFVGFCLLTLFSGHDRDIIFGNGKVSLPLINVQVDILPFYYVGPVLCLLLFITLHLHLLRLVRLAKESNPDDPNHPDHVFPFMLYQSLAKPEWGLLGKLQVLIADVSAYSSIVIALVAFTFSSLKLHDPKLLVMTALVLGISLFLRWHFYKKGRWSIFTKSRFAWFCRKTSEVILVCLAFSGTFLGIVSYFPDKEWLLEINRHGLPFLLGLLLSLWLIHKRRLITSFLFSLPLASILTFLIPPPDWFMFSILVLYVALAFFLACTGNTLLKRIRQKAPTLRWNLFSYSILHQSINKIGFWAPLSFLKKWLPQKVVSHPKLSIVLEMTPVEVFRFCFLLGCAFIFFIVISGLVYASGLLNYFSHLRGETFGEPPKFYKEIDELFGEKIGKDQAWFSAPGKYIAYADLQGSTWLKANLEGVIFSHSDLSLAKFIHCNLTKATLTNTNFTGANLSGAKLSGAKLIEANLFEAVLWGSDLSNADLSNAKLMGANLTGAKLIGANLFEAVLWGSDLSNADLSSVNLYGATLTNTNFRGANLSGAYGEDEPGKKVPLTFEILTAHGVQWDEDTIWPDGKKRKPAKRP